MIVNVDIIRPVILRYITTAYSDLAGRSEPKISAFELYDYLKQHAIWRESGLDLLSDRSARTAVRNIVEGMRKRHEVGSSIAADTKGRDMRCYEPVS